MLHGPGSKGNTYVETVGRTGQAASLVDRKLMKEDARSRVVSLSSEFTPSPAHLEPVPLMKPEDTDTAVRSAVSDKNEPQHPYNSSSVAGHCSFSAVLELKLTATVVAHRLLGSSSHNHPASTAERTKCHSNKRSGQRRLCSARPGRSRRKWCSWAWLPC